MVSIQEEIEEALRDFSMTKPGIVSIAVSSIDGLPIAYYGREDVKFGEICAMSALIANSINTVERNLNINDIYLLIGLGSNSNIIIYTENNFSIFLLCDESTNVGMIKITINDLAKKIKENLDE